MSQTGNNTSDMLNSFGETANHLVKFFNALNENMTPSQKEELNKQFGGDFSKELTKTQNELAKAMSDINKANESHR